MALVDKIDSNSVGLRIAEEQSYGVLSGADEWVPQEPNSFSDFGGQVSMVARSPITEGRQRKKGVSTGIDVNAGFNFDLTQENLPWLAQGVVFADLRTKDELDVASVDGVGSNFEPAAGGDAYAAGDLLYAQGFDDAANNGLHVVTAALAASVTVASALVTAAGQSGMIRRVGFEFATADAEIDAAGALPALVSTAKDLTTLGVIPGEWVFIGGDTAASQFPTAENNGFARVRSVAAGRITFDKTANTMVTEASVGEVRLFLAPRVIKNESDPTLIARRSYQLERTLGAPDDASTDKQAEYIAGAIPNTLQINVPTEDKITVDLAFLGKDATPRTAAEGLKAGTRPDVEESDAFNTSTDVVRSMLALVDDADSAPTPLFAFAQEFSLSVANNLTPAKAVGVFGAFAITAGMFAVSGQMTVYLASVEALDAVRNNSDVTFDYHLAKDNQGISIDVPLVSLGDGRPNVSADNPITLPINFEAASGAKVHPDLDHTLLMQWWDYLPDLASA